MSTFGNIHTTKAKNVKEVGRWSKKTQNLVNIVCERPPTRIQMIKGSEGTRQYSTTFCSSRLQTKYHECISIGP